MIPRQTNPEPKIEKFSTGETVRKEIQIQNLRSKIEC